MKRSFILLTAMEGDALSAVGGDVLSVAGTLLTLICVLILAYCLSRFLGKRLARVSSSSNRNMRVIEQLGLGTNGQLILLKVKEDTYLIGVSQAGIRMLGRMEGEFEEISPIEKKSIPTVFEQVLKKYKTPQNSGEVLQETDKESKDE
ncbi:MAG: flagellar biosynthetic protein FliO [Lachnospiraceae bacterium]|nr:flagellar biosynthetic protein FliO [Lachnospiraceae bacterium]